MRAVADSDDRAVARRAISACVTADSLSAAYESVQIWMFGEPRQMGHPCNLRTLTAMRCCCVDLEADYITLIPSESRKGPSSGVRPLRTPLSTSKQRRPYP